MPLWPSQLRDRRSIERAERQAARDLDRLVARVAAEVRRRRHRNEEPPAPLGTARGTSH